MSRKLRHIRDGGAPVEVTCRTINSLFLLRPCGLLNAIIVGALARAKSLHPVELSAFAFASNHFHLLCWVETVKDLARFMNHFNSKLAREIARLRGWHDKIWSRRYQAIEISDEPRAQEGRLRYVLSHGVKEFLVERPDQWPGVHAASPLVGGEPLEGWWFDRTKEYAARRRGKEPDLFEFATCEVLELDLLPCWRGLSAEERREHAASMIDAIVAEAAADRHARGIEVLGATGVLEQDPFGRPEKSKKSPAPHFHAASKKAFMDLKAAYSEFYAEYREAAEKLKAGERLVEFPVTAVL